MLYLSWLEGKNGLKVYIDYLKYPWNEIFYVFKNKSISSKKDCRLKILDILSSSRVTKLWRYYKIKAKSADTKHRNQLKLIKINQNWSNLWHHIHCL